VIEAVGMGCYVIATDVGGTNEITGIELIKKNSATILQEALQEALNN
jgi:glycosyltransferase involved in cell wall biosynthesis